MTTQSPNPQIEQLLAELRSDWDYPRRAAAEIASFTLPAVPDTPTRSAERCAACHSHLPLSAHAPRDLARHIFMLNVRDFMDPYTFNVKNVMKCCLEFLTPDGRMIPFCSYNSVGYRERVVAGLMGSTT